MSSGHVDRHRVKHFDLPELKGSSKAEYCRDPSTHAQRSTACCLDRHLYSDLLHLSPKSRQKFQVHLNSVKVVHTIRLCLKLNELIFRFL